MRNKLQPGIFAQQQQNEHGHQRQQAKIIIFIGSPAL
jgi:hypothetical protein